MSEKFITLVLLVAAISCSKRIHLDSLRFSAVSLDGVYIPYDLEDCYVQIDSFFSDSMKLEIMNWSEDDFTSRYHFGLGMSMRNNWGLWKGSRLSKYFNELKIFHPDDMSGIILTSYHRKLNKRDIEFENQIKYYHEYWESLKSKE